MIYVIDVNYLSENYPIPFSVDTKRIKAVISMTQRIELRGTLGDSLYQSVLDFIEEGELEDNPIYNVIDEIRMLHALYSAKAMFTAYYKEGEPDVRDYNIAYIDGNIRTLEQFVVSSVVGNPSVYKVASEAKDNVFDEDISNFGGIYYPNT